MNATAMTPRRIAAIAAWLLLLGAIAGCAPATSTVPTPPIRSATALSAPGTVPAGNPTTPGTVRTATAVSATPQAAVSVFNFDQDPVGGLPAGAVSFSGAWAVRAEADAPTPSNALCQTGSATFPALSLTSQPFADVSIAVRFKAISGNTDRAAGIIFRIQDRNNYYIVRANALEDNVNIYKYVHGQRIQIKEGAGKVPAGKWQELRVETNGNRIRGFLEGQAVVETSDDTYRTGTVGLWTKADSVTCFDNLRIEAR